MLSLHISNLMTGPNTIVTVRAYQTAWSYSKESVFGLNRLRKSSRGRVKFAESVLSGLKGRFSLVTIRIISTTKICGDGLNLPLFSARWRSLFPDPRLAKAEIQKNPATIDLIPAWMNDS